LPTIAVLAALALSAHAGEPPSVVSDPVRVIDGDTVALINTNTHVRLNGVDPPEVVHPGYEHDDDFGQEARSEMQPDYRRSGRALRVEWRAVVRATTAGAGGSCERRTLRISAIPAQQILLRPIFSLEPRTKDFFLP
jgi:hypothetical protein